MSTISPRARRERWVLAYAGLSAAWSLKDGDDPRTAAAVGGEAFSREVAEWYALLTTAHPDAYPGA